MTKAHAQRTHRLLVATATALVVLMASYFTAAPIVGAHGDHDHGDNHSHDHDHDHDDDHDHGDDDSSVHHDDHATDIDLPIEAGKLVVNDGHLDLNVLVRNGQDIGLYAQDDSTEPPVWRDIDDLVIAVGDIAKQAIPDDSSFSFLGVEAGAEVHVLDLMQTPGIPWVGWSAEDHATMQVVRGDITVSLTDVDGPGAVSMFLSTGMGGEPQVIWQSESDAPQPLTISRNSHGHGTWTFTKPGIYHLGLDISGELQTGEIVNHHQTLRFVVGDGIDPMAAFDVDDSTPSDSSLGADGDDLQSDQATATDQAVVAPLNDDGSALSSLRWIALGAIVLALFVGAILFRDRRAFNEASESIE